mgnify:CR=1 FL=1
MCSSHLVPGEHDDMVSFYREIKNQSLPVFVTTDSVYNGAHLFFDYSLRIVEMESLLPALRALTKSMADHFVSKIASFQKDEAEKEYSIESLLLKNLAFFGVARKLLEPEWKAPREVEERVHQELKLIQEQRVANSSIFGYQEDYSQYAPRGHYTRHEEFKKYFQAMMWYGRMFYPVSHPNLKKEEMEELTVAAILLVQAMDEVEVGGKKGSEVWKNLYEVTSFFSGTSEDLTVSEYQRLVREVWEKTPSFSKSKVQEFIQKARKSSHPRILSHTVTDEKSKEQKSEAIEGFRFMGQRFIPDSFIFQELVYDKVTQYHGNVIPFSLILTPAGAVRGFPRAMDIPAVLGSKRALEILQSEGETSYKGYDSQLAALERYFKGYSLSDWKKNAYSAWLYTLLPMIENEIACDEKSPHFPKFTQSQAWKDRLLNSLLGSWVELRHDTVLYAKQSTTVFAIGLPELTLGYVDPYPEVYRRVESMVRALEERLKAYGLWPSSMDEGLSNFKHLLQTLAAISEKQLQGKELDEEEQYFIQNYGNNLDGAVGFTQEIRKKYGSEADASMACVVDVHTEPNTQQTLTVALGRPNVMYVRVPDSKGNLRVAQGAVFSFYEFKGKMENRMTDEAWQKKIAQGNEVFPGWTNSFFVK